MRNSCPHCSSNQTIELAQLDTSNSCNGSCSARAQELFQSDMIASLYPPPRRRTGMRILAFFLASVFLAWPIDLLFARHFIATHPTASVVAFHRLPVMTKTQQADSLHMRDTEPDRELLASIPDITTILLLLVASLSLVLLLALNLHRARRYNQTVWGPAMERWTRSRYCIACTRVYEALESETDSEIDASFSSVPANPFTA